MEDRRYGDFGFFRFVEESLGCYLAGDWGDFCQDDRELNDEAIAAEQRGETTDSLFSMYHHTDGTEIYIITEWDRSVTTIMSPMSIDKPVTGRGPRTPCPHDDEGIQPPGSIISWDQHVIIPRIDDDR